MNFFHDLLSTIFLANLHYIIISVSLSCVLVCLIIVFFRKKSSKIPAIIVPDPGPNLVITSSDIRAIAGDDMIATQLDLARGYIEMSKSNLAKKILKHVTEHGTPHQQQQAAILMNSINPC